MTRLHCRFALLLTFVFALLTGRGVADDVPAELSQSTSEQLWAEFIKAPYNHPNIPNVSFAGYQFSERPLPTPKIVAKVKDHGAKGDGQNDDSAAFQLAINDAKQKGGGAISIPAGHYKLSKVIVLDDSNLVLRGEGSGNTILEFADPISRLVPWCDGSFYGGLIWVEQGGPAERPVDVEINIQPLANSVPIVNSAKQGDFELEVSADNAAKLKPLIGKMVRIAWTGGRELAMQIAGHESMAAFDWKSWRELYDGQMTWIWGNQIESVDDTRIRFKKPLRMDAKAGGVCIGTDSPYLTEVGIEGLTIQFPSTSYLGHHKEHGYNGLFLRRVAHGWVRDVRVVNADNGLNLSGECINCTVTDFQLTGRPNHHGTMMRYLSHDNLMQSFRIASKPIHGINTEGQSSGNVWRDGTMEQGTFDSHCMMSFDSVRTNITIRNTGSAGGNSTHGPFSGRRMCHWNIRVTNGVGKRIASPAQMPRGAIVGIQGAKLDLIDTKLKQMPDGLQKGSVIADLNHVPVPEDLFEAQLKLRLKGASPAISAATLPSKQ